MDLGDVTDVARLVLVASAQHRPERTAWTFGERRASYPEFAVRVRVLAAGLADRGAATG